MFLSTWVASLVLLVGLEPVTHAGFGEQVAGAARVRFELAP